MRKILLLSFLTFTYGAKAQLVSTFESLPLSRADTYYVNYTDPGTDVGFDDGSAYFPCFYDTAWGGLWSSGFAYSNMTDTVTAGYTNMYAARPGKGARNSDQYVVAWETRNVVHLKGAAAGTTVRGCYLTNSTYAYFSMRDGDGFTPAFSAANGDWFKLTIRAYSGGQLGADSVEFYLADFRSADSKDHFILGTWEWVDLSSLGNADSLQFLVSSSDIMKPAYFCMDDFNSERPEEPGAGIATASGTAEIKIYPNPAAEFIYVESSGTGIRNARLFDLSGRLMTDCNTGTLPRINISDLAPGTYILSVQDNEGRKSAMRFQKQ